MPTPCEEERYTLRPQPQGVADFAGNVFELLTVCAMGPRFLDGETTIPPRSEWKTRAVNSDLGAASLSIGAAKS